MAAHDDGVSVKAVWEWNYKWKDKNALTAVAVDVPRGVSFTFPCMADLT